MPRTRFDWYITHQLVSKCCHVINSFLKWILSMSLKGKTLFLFIFSSLLLVFLGPEDSNAVVYDVLSELSFN